MNPPVSDLPQFADSPRGSRVGWIYCGVWGVLARLFLVPEEPPELPSLAGEPIQSFRPARNFLRYMLLNSMIGFGILAFALLAVVIGVLVVEPEIGLLLLGIALPLIVIGGGIMVLAIHLRYDTTWYVLSDRSLRSRRGIWVIRETTITFENIQNVTVQQGPLQRMFAIADVLVETAGGGGLANAQQQAALGAGHHGLIEGVAEAPAIRDLLIAKMRASTAGGLGDDESRPMPPGHAGRFGPQHVELLREVRNAAVRLAAGH